MAPRSWSPEDASPPPGTCAWEQTGRATYKLTRLAMAYADGAYVGPADIAEKAVLDAEGNSFHGCFTITAYTPCPPRHSGATSSTRRT